MKKEERNSRNVSRGRRCNSIASILDILYIGVVIILLIHLIALQIFDPHRYRERGKMQRASHDFELRGDIYDRNGIKLATDRIYYNIYARPVDYTKNETPAKIAKLFSPVLGMPEQTLYKKLSDKSIKVISLKKNVDRDTEQKLMKIISKNNFRSISLDKKDERDYPQGVFASHVLGFYNYEANVSSGVEYSARDKLEHVVKAAGYQQTRDGKIIYKFSTDPVAPTINPKGLDVYLTIDAAIQHVCEKELYKIIKEKAALRGAVIVMNPKNGEILAYAVYPTYDPNNFQKVPPLTLKNWTLTDVYPPGSTFKIITVTSAMELGKINEHSIIPDQGRMKFGGYTIENYDYKQKGAPGKINLVYLFEHSSNIGSVNVGALMTHKEFYTMLKKFGFGEKSGIDLPGESSGLLASPKYWDKGIHMTMSYGYGTSVSIMQMVSAVSALANNGVRVTPHVIKYTPEEAEDKIKRIPTISPQTAKTITRLLVESVNAGKSVIKSSKYNIAAKTGTSRKPLENGRGYSGTMYTSTIGYFPAEDPQVLIYVVVDSARKGPVWGNTIAGPVFHEVSEQVARILDLKPDKIQPAKTTKQ
ncbi:MAG: penicillin-binding protein 2 [Cyanobacteriota bacterium]|nr:penicillin-binding protein 2 [Cyanobacteriota bacterium]MDY6358031.1 penicillin-binding protein 2 [Cyanobacteriota bacterium]MDY6363873.1 penicillin-binding protein 2 [Cyanobacteriota bacterium]MDY6383685.1 penicillin-binding protein 2 [Cyanobacteriota bacterium]